MTCLSLAGSFPKLPKWPGLSYAKASSFFQVFSLAEWFKDAGDPLHRWWWHYPLPQCQTHQSFSLPKHDRLLNAYNGSQLLHKVSMSFMPFITQFPFYDLEGLKVSLRVSQQNPGLTCDSSHASLEIFLSDSCLQLLWCGFEDIRK